MKKHNPQAVYAINPEIEKYIERYGVQQLLLIISSICDENHNVRDSSLVAEHIEVCARHPLVVESLIR